MPVQRVKQPAWPAEEVAQVVEQIEAAGGTVTQVTQVGDEWWILHTSAPQRRPASTKGRQTRSGS